MSSFKMFECRMLLVECWLLIVCCFNCWAGPPGWRSSSHRWSLAACGPPGCSCWSCSHGAAGGTSTGRWSPPASSPPRSRRTGWRERPSTRRWRGRRRGRHIPHVQQSSPWSPQKFLSAQISRNIRWRNIHLGNKR